MDAAGAGRRAAGIDGIAGLGWRMRLRVSVRRFPRQRDELVIEGREEIIKNHLLEMSEEELLVPLEAGM